MRVETTTRNLYKFDELSEKAQQTALEKQAEFEGEVFEPDDVYEDAATIAELFGLDIRQTRKKSGGYDPTIYYSGFWSQGDGACFEGFYSYRKSALKAVKDYASQDAELHRIAAELQDVQKDNLYQLTATCKHSGHYYHSGCMSVSVERQSDNYQDMTADAEDRITQALRDFADWTYNQLQKEYDYRVSPEACKEAIEANEYEFTADGEIA